MPVAAATRIPNATQVPEGWRDVCLADVVDINRDSWSPGDEEETIRYLDLTAVLAPGSVAEPLELASAAAPSRARRRVHSGDILVSTVRPNLRGFARIIGASSNLIASTGFAVLSPRRSTISSYIYHHVMTPGFAAYLENATTGQAYPAVRPADVAAYRLNLPPLSEQRAIATVLDSIDEAIERTDEVISATERLRDAVLHEFLARGLPGQHSEWKEVPGLGTIPASWRVIRLGDVAEVRSGQVDPRDPELQHLQFVAPDDIESATRRLILRRRVSDARAISGKYEFDEHDVIYSKIRPYLMKVYMPKNRGLCSADMYPIRPRGGLTRNYLALVLVSPSFTDYARTCSDRTGIPKINRTDLLRFQLRLPSLSEQRAIGAVCDSVDTAIERARAERCDLQSLQASTADALLTGRVRTSAC